MVFSSFTFLFAFLPLVLLLYASAPRPLRNPVLLFASYFFYAWGAPKVLPLLFVGSLVDFYLARFLLPGGRQQRRRLAFKYANFFVEQLNASVTALGMQAIPWLSIALPIGISFYTFQKISYLIDVFRGEADPASSFFDYALYVAFFPQLIAGPIIRYLDLDKQLKSRTHSLSLMLYGANRFSFGLAKKILIADPMGQVARNIFELDPSQLSTSYAWVGAVAYSFQIYFDFSAYSDMAIGLGAAFGFRIPENFNFPYVSRTLTEFWRRWHISLSTWMREYLYIPLGGNKVSTFRLYTNLWIVFLLSGFWHGASWTFVLWGAFHGFFLTLDRIFLARWMAHIPRGLAAICTYVIVVFSWVLFRTESIEQTLIFYSAMLGFGE
ncbi:UNVERIFIED_CONTAM: hypothetical protein GTU68_031952, partial [Idotea baltica]|nr:hypothetical protein [Idotea baltica]